jgi:hypothetical protein
VYGPAFLLQREISENQCLTPSTSHIPHSIPPSPPLLVHYCHLVVKKEIEHQLSVTLRQKNLRLKKKNISILSLRLSLNNLSNKNI